MMTKNQKPCGSCHAVQNNCDCTQSRMTDGEQNKQNMHIIQIKLNTAVWGKLKKQKSLPNLGQRSEFC